MRPLNSSLDAKREELKADVEAWLAQGNKIPLIPIMVRDDLASFSEMNRAANHRSVTQSPSSKRIEGMKLIAQGLPFTSIALKLLVHRKTVATWAKEIQKR